MSLASCLIAGVLGVSILISNLKKEVESELKNQADDLITAGFSDLTVKNELPQIPVRIQKALVVLENPIIRIFDSSHHLIYSTMTPEKSSFLDPFLNLDPLQMTTAEKDGEQFRITLRSYKLASGESRVLQLANGLPNTSKVLRQSSIMYILVLIVFLILSSFVARAFTMNLLSPIKQVASHLGSLSLIEPKRWTAIPQVGDSQFLGEMIAAGNHLIARVQESSFAGYYLSQSIAHEIRTPLTIIMGEIEAFRNSQECKEELAQMLDQFVQDILHIEVIVKSLLELGQRDRDHNPQNPRPIELKRLVQECVVQIKRVFGIVVRVHFLPEENCWVMIDPDLFSILIDNLLRNSFKHGGSHILPRIIVQNPSSDSVMLSLLDNGPGLALDVISAANSATSSHPQLGIGLNLCRQVCNLSGWKIYFENINPTGLSVTIELPISRPDRNSFDFTNEPQEFLHEI